MHGWIKGALTRIAPAPKDKLERDGVVKVKGFLNHADVTKLQKLVALSYSEIDTAITSGRHSIDPVFVDQFKTWNAVWAPLLVDRSQEVVTLWNEVQAAITKAERRLFGAQWNLRLDRTYFRKHHSQKTLINWHIDADAAGMIGYGPESINVWMPLQDVGTDAPSIEFARGSHIYMKQQPVLPAGQASREDDWVRDTFPNSRWTPIAKPGDAIVFSHWTLHRTQISGMKTHQRSSCEFRFTT